ncbi:MAG: hypothetical protein ACRDY6_10835 [Acidimicrobiia bacterium]
MFMLGLVGLVGLGLGVVVSVFLSFERMVGLSNAWPLTFEDVPDGPVWVAVYSPDPRTKDRAHDTLPVSGRSSCAKTPADDRRSHPGERARLHRHKGEGGAGHRR